MRSHRSFLIAAAVAACSLFAACDQRPADPALTSTIDVDWSLIAHLDRDERFTTSVWASSDQDVYVGRARLTGDGLIDVEVTHFDGASWTAVPVSLPENQQAPRIWGSGPADVYVANGRLNHFNGAGWSVVPVDAHRVTGSSAQKVFISNDRAILEFDGAEWDTLLTVDGMTVVALAAAPDGSLFAGFDGERFELWNGASWIDTGWPVECAYFICAFSMSDAFAIGACGGDDRIYHWDGVTWTQQATTTEYLTGIGGNRGSNVFAIGLRGALLHYDGAEWQTQDRVTAQHLRQVYGSPSGVVIAGQEDAVLWIDAQGARVLKDPVPPGIYSIAAESPSRFVISDLRAVYRYQDDRFVEAPLPRYGEVRVLACRRIDDLYAIVDGNLIAHHNGGGWDRVDSLAVPLMAAWVSPDGTAYASGDGAVYRHAASWETIWVKPADDYVFMHLIGGDGGNGIVVVGESYSRSSTIIMHFDGANWSDLPPPDDGVAALWSGPDMDLYVAGHRAFYHWDGESFRKIPGPLDSFGSVLMGTDDGRVIGMNSREVAIFNGAYLSVSPAQGPRVATHTPEGSIVAQVGRDIMSWRP